MTRREALRIAAFGLSGGVAGYLVRRYGAPKADAKFASLSSGDAICVSVRYDTTDGRILSVAPTSEFMAMMVATKIMAARDDARGTVVTGKVSV